MSRFVVTVLAAGALATLTGCADYAYRARTASGHPVAVAVYPIPEQAPHGVVTLRSPGVEPLPAPASARGLHVVMDVRNDGRRPWSIDTRRETVVLPDGSVHAATLALVGGAPTSQPIVEVPVGARRTIDLYFPLPAGQAQARRLPAFAADWQVQTGHGTLRGQASFHRVDLSGPTMPCGAHATAYCLAGYTA